METPVTDNEAVSEVDGAFIVFEAIRWPSQASTRSAITVECPQVIIDIDKVVTENVVSEVALEGMFRELNNNVEPVEKLIQNEEKLPPSTLFADFSNLFLHTAGELAMRVMQGDILWYVSDFLKSVDHQPDASVNVQYMFLQLYKITRTRYENNLQLYNQQEAGRACSFQNNCSALREITEDCFGFSVGTYPKSTFITSTTILNVGTVKIDFARAIAEEHLRAVLDKIFM